MEPFGKPFVHHETSKDRAVALRHGRDHFSQLRATPFDFKPLPVSRAPGHTTIDRVDGLQEKLRPPEFDTSTLDAQIAALDARLDTLEALTTGLSRQGFSVCVGGTSVTKTFVAS